MRPAVLALLVILLLGGILAFRCHECSINTPALTGTSKFAANAAAPAVDPVESMLGAVDGLISRQG